MSPVIGVALLAVVVMMLAAVSGAMFYSMTESKLDDPSPFAATTSDVEVQITADDVQNEFVLRHEGGDTVDTGSLQMVVDTDGHVERAPLTEFTDGDAESWGAGSALRVAFDEDTVCAGDADEVTVSVVHEGDRSAVLSEKTVPVAREGFVIENGAVRPVVDYAVEVTVVATSYKYYNWWGQPVGNAPIFSDVYVGGEARNPFPGNINNEGNPRSETFDGVAADSEIVVEMIGDPGGFDERVNSREESERVWLLRDGDPIPEVEGYGDQADVASYLDPYVDAEAGVVTLDRNQAIYLFELGTAGPENGDFNDAVVVVDLETTEESFVTKSEGRDVVVCSGG